MDKLKELWDQMKIRMNIESKLETERPDQTLASKLFTQMAFRWSQINRLAGVIATFNTFDTNPPTPANMTDGDFTTDSGTGIKSLAGVNGDIGNIYFDMGNAYPILLTMYLNCHRASGDGSISLALVTSLDNINWTTSATVDTGMSGDAYKVFRAYSNYARYIRLYFLSASVTVNPSVFHVVVNQVQALQLL